MRCCNEPRLCAWRAAAALIVSDARISFRIEHVGEKVDQQENHGQEQDAALDRRQIALLNRQQHVASHAGPGKYRLGENTSGEIIANVESEHGDNRKQRVPSVSAGSTRNAIPPYPDGGSHCSATANNRIRSKPTQ